MSVAGKHRKHSIVDEEYRCTEFEAEKNRKHSVYKCQEKKAVIRVNFFESVQNHTHCPSIEMETAENLNVLIKNLGEKFGEPFKEYLLADDTCFFLVNGKSIINTGGLNTPLHPGDKVEILPVVEAG